MISTVNLSNISVGKNNIVGNIAFYSYVFSVVLSPLGPVLHYSLWTICLLSLLYDCIVNKKSLLICELGHDGKWIFCFFTLLIFWSAIAGLFTYQEINAYGKNVTMPLELWFGTYFAMKTLGSGIARERFIKIFLWGSFVILLGNFLRVIGLLNNFPNGSLDNGNALGALGLYLFAPCISFVFWAPTGSSLKKISILIPVIGVIFFSFSSGVWLSAFLCGLVFLWYAVKFKKLCARICLITTISLLVAYLAANRYTNGEVQNCFLIEIQQITSVGNVEQLTTQRNEIWNACFYLTKQRPITGWGGQLFYDVYVQLFNTKAHEIGLKKMQDATHPHSTYFYLAYISGIPGMVFFLLAMGLGIKKTLALVKLERDASFPWALSILLLLIAVLTYGTNGDVFQGRRDISVMVWCFLGILIILPEKKNKEHFET